MIKINKKVNSSSALWKDINQSSKEKINSNKVSNPKWTDLQKENTVGKLFHL